jgi:hypothetical protein
MKHVITIVKCDDCETEIYNDQTDIKKTAVNINLDTGSGWFTYNKVKQDRTAWGEAEDIKEVIKAVYETKLKKQQLTFCNTDCMKKYLDKLWVVKKVEKSNKNVIEFKTSNPF